MKKEAFHLPEDTIYLDGNSLGPLPKTASERLSKTIYNEWGEMLIKGWNEAGWMDQPRKLGDKLGLLLGCAQGSIVLGDTLSIKVYQALAAALNMSANRKVVLSDSGNFPTDLYMADGLLKTLDKGHELRVVAPEDVISNITDEIAVLMLTQVDYRTGRMHDMNQLTQAAHDVGTVVIWDLAHSAGAVPVNMAQSNAEFAVGCTYKYLNGGPGAPAFIYSRPDIADLIEPALSGWLGHEAPFAFDRDYRPAKGNERMRVGTPPIIQLAVLEAALDIWDDVSIEDIRTKSIELSELFIKEVEERCLQLKLASPRNPSTRGSQVSFTFEHGYAVMQALINEGVIGDFRAPNIIRFGFAPLYNDADDVLGAANILENIMTNKIWDQPKFKKRAAVT
ncbi:kynureninase [Lentilitoribacter sp. Alg239-R112]|uniref:kynureninase n=1 Tax=Lentilitoribacter sp. Alg239-R112 TaxID=2305987 RepID=UPI0013A6CE7B|nr:kynureninase [Lentilitoribacter sp. Alg239-R112]